MLYIKHRFRQTKRYDPFPCKKTTNTEIFSRWTSVSYKATRSGEDCNISSADVPKLAQAYQKITLNTIRVYSNYTKG